MFYEANREHLAWSAVEILVALRGTMLKRIREELESWQLRPVHASLFGSTARGDGDSNSDIDILLIRPDGVGEDEPPWGDQIDRLQHRVERWTGNRCQAFQLDLARLAQHVEAHDPLIDEWRRDAIALAGEGLPVVLQELSQRRGQS